MCDACGGLYSHLDSCPTRRYATAVAALPTPFLAPRLPIPQQARLLLACLPPAPAPDLGDAPAVRDALAVERARVEMLLRFVEGLR